MGAELPPAGVPATANTMLAAVLQPSPPSLPVTHVGRVQPLGQRVPQPQCASDVHMLTTAMRGKKVLRGVWDGVGGSSSAIFTAGLVSKTPVSNPALSFAW